MCKWTTCPSGGMGYSLSGFRDTVLWARHVATAGPGMSREVHDASSSSPHGCPGTRAAPWVYQSRFHVVEIIISLIHNT